MSLRSIGLPENYGENLRGRKIVVTGATGFVGGWIARTLSEYAGENAFGVLAQGRNPRLLAELEAEGIRSIAGDLADPAFAEKLVAGSTDVIHCAALSSPWGTYGEFHRANVVATELLADAALRTGIKRFIHFSTPSIYTERRHRRRIRENDSIPSKKVSFYGDTKWLAELALDQRIAKGLWAIKFRPLNVLGPRDATVFPRLLRLVERAIIPILPDGGPETDLTPIENVVQATLQGLVAPAEMSGRNYNLSNDEPIEVARVLAILHEELGIRARPKSIRPALAFRLAEGIEWVHRNLLAGKEPKVTVHALCSLIYSRSLDVSAAKKDLGFKPLGNTEGYLRTLVRDQAR